MQHLEVSGAVRHIYVIRRLKVKVYEKRGPFSPVAILLVGHTVVKVYSNNPHGDGKPKCSI